MTFRSRVERSRVSCALPLVLPVALALCIGAPFGARAQSSTAVVPLFQTRADSVAPEATTKVMQATVWLKLHDQQELDRTVSSLYEEGSSSYHHWLTAAQLAKFQPTAQDMAEVKKQLAVSKLTILSTGPNNMYLRVSGTVSELQSTFNTQINRYSYRGKVITAAARPAQLSGPAGSLVAHVGGLSGTQVEQFIKRPVDPRTRKPVPFVPVKAPSSSSKVTPLGIVYASNCFRAPESHTFPSQGGRLPLATYSGNRYGADNSNTIMGTLATCGYSPIELQTAYGLTSDYGAGLLGQGQTIVIVDAFGSATLRSDLAAFSRMNHLPQLNSSSFKILYPLGPFAPPSFPDMETTLDVEWAHAAAPKANIVLLLVPDLQFDELQEANLYAISNQFGNNISNSFGSPEVFTDPGDMIIWNTLGELAASQGISMNFSSGDHGDNAAAFGTVSPDAPSNSPFVTSVGGTSVALFGNGDNHIKFQTGWGNNATQMTFVGDGSPIDPPSPDGFVYGAGGGESQFFAKPAWQRNLPGAGRQQPDVSAVADPYTGVEIVLTENGALTVGTIGGTSVACPFFSGIWAIANQKAGHPLGLAAPSLYNLPVNAFYDVRPYSSPTNVTGTVANTRGSTFYSAAKLAGPLQNNRKFYSAFWDFGLGGFFNLTFGTDSSLTTAVGWDNVTGMGTPNGLAFIQAVAK